MGYIVSIIVYCCVYAVGATGLSLLTGFTGLFSLGHAGFMAVGAYTTVVLNMQLGIPYVLLLGEDEIAQNKVALKDLTTGQQTLLTVAEAAEQVAAGLAIRNAGAPIKEN